VLLKLLGRWLFRIAGVLAISFLVAFAGDWVVFKLRGSPQSKVTVSRYMGIPLKGQKEEFDYLGTSDVPCASALFPHGGQSPCWQLKRDANQWQNF
jgi:hypothetical protein